MLEELRKEIDEVNLNILKYFEMRMKLVKDVAIYKEENDLPITNISREKQVISQMISSLENKDIEEETVELFKKIISLSKVYENRLMNKDRDKIAYQGVPGSYSYEAMTDFFGENSKAINVKTFEDVFEKIKNHEATYGILPIENSSTGAINEVYDLILKYNFFICNEMILKIDSNLMCIEGGSLDKIEEVFSHEQGFSQSKVFLKGYPDWKLTNYFNTALSAKYIKELNDPTKAAIASKNAANIYGLKILAENINFNPDNYTRFIVIKSKMKVNDDSDKISIVLSLPHKSGSLHNILTYFSDYNLNMVKIESRPDLVRPFEYMFYIDFEGNIKDDMVKKVLDDIRNNSTYFKILGNYKGAYKDAF